MWRTLGKNVRVQVWHAGKCHEHGRHNRQYSDSPTLDEGECLIGDEALHEYQRRAGEGRLPHERDSINMVERKKDHEDVVLGHSRRRDELMEVDDQVAMREQHSLG